MSKARRLVSTVALCALATVLGCGTAAPAHPELAVRDSAGVEIIETPGDLTSGLSTIGFSTEPVALIDGPFSGIEGVEVLDGGGVVVADEFANEIRVYSVSGALLHQVGGDGDGPTELRGPSIVRDMANPNIVYGYDRRKQKVLKFDVARGYLSPLGILEGLHRTVGALAPVAASNGALIFKVNDIDEATLMARKAGTLSFSQQVWSVDVKSGNQTMVAEYEVPYAHRKENNGPAWDIPFPLRIDVASSSQGAIVTTPGPAEVRLFDPAGNLSRVLRVAEARQPVTKAELAHWNEVRDFTEGGPASPDSVPFFDRVLVDDRGRVWARRFTIDPTAMSIWLVFRDDGVVGWLARVPGGFEMKSVSSDYAAGVILGKFAEERIAVYGISEGVAR